MQVKELSDSEIEALAVEAEKVLIHPGSADPDVASVMGVDFRMRLRNFKESISPEAILFICRKALNRPNA